MVFMLSVSNYSAREELEEERRCCLCSEAEGYSREMPSGDTFPSF